MSRDITGRERAGSRGLGAFSREGWYAWTGEEQELRRCAERTAALLE